MKKLFLLAGVAALTLTGPAFAAGDLSRADVQHVPMKMGTDDDGHMYFEPNDLTFETGKAYDWELINVDEIKHEVSFDHLRERVFFRKAEIEDADGELVAEIKGDFSEIEVGPHQTVQLFIVPIQDVDSIDFACEIEGHKEAGMFGKIHLN